MMRPASWALSLPLLLSCDGLFVANPDNCAVSATSCAQDSICNVVTKRCEPVTRFVLGQPTPDVNLNLAWGLSSPQAVLLVKDKNAGGKTKLIVADTGNSRVLIWNTVPSSNAVRRPPDVVLGQADLTTNQLNYAAISGKSLASPSALSSDGIKLIVGDTGNNRLLIWNSIPIQNYALASTVWGQASTGSRVANSPNGLASALSLTAGYPYALPSGALFLADALNNRLLGFAAIPANQTVAANTGFPSLTASAPGMGKMGMTNPQGSPYADASMVVVPDSNNHRLVIFNYKQTNGVPSGLVPASVIGQASLTMGNSANTGLGGLNTPSGVTQTSDGAGAYFWVADTGNSRILRFPAMGGSTADVLLGQSTAGGNLPNAGGAPSASTLNLPRSISTDGQRLAVADTANHRVLLWNQLPTGLFSPSGPSQPADVIVGQRDETLSLINSPPAVTGLQFSNASAVTGDAQHLIIADSGHHRVLIWNALPKNNMTLPDVVLGQTDLTQSMPNGGSGTVTAGSLNSPVSVHFDGTHLAVADQGNNRVLIWNQLPTANNSDADFVVGQASFTSNLENIVGGSKPPPTAQSLRMPGWVHQDGGQLFVADSLNNRVLIYPSPYQNSPEAILALGQGDLNSAVDASVIGLNVGMANPGAVVVSDSHLVVSDTNNNRVLIWNSIPTLSGQSADVVLGQSDFFSSASPLRPAPDVLLAPRGLLINGNMLMVADKGQHRVLFWRQLPTTLGQEADGVLGQPDLRLAIENSPEIPNIKALNSPSALWSQAERLYIGDAGNNRVVYTTVP